MIPPKQQQDAEDAEDAESRGAIISSAFLRVIRVFIWGVLSVPGALRAQHHVGPTTISVATREQIRTVERSALRLGDSVAAASAGFQPVFGWIPTMGTHWVSPARMLAGKRFDSEAPPQLMFSRIEGKQTLVGAAFAYLANQDDTTRPASFDGNPPWHEHPDLAPPGLTLVMLHVWFVPSPDGPFAGHNPWLPFWALGLNPPDSSRLRDHRDARRVRLAALALGEIADTGGTFPRLAQRVPDQLGTRRKVIRSLIPALESAGKSDDWNRWSRIADRLAVEWGEIRKIYLGAVQRPEFRSRIEKFLEEMETGGH